MRMDLPNLANCIMAQSHCLCEVLIKTISRALISDVKLNAATISVITSDGRNIVVRFFPWLLRISYTTFDVLHSALLHSECAFEILVVYVQAGHFAWV